MTDIIGSTANYRFAQTAKRMVIQDIDAHKQFVQNARNQATLNMPAAQCRKTEGTSPTWCEGAQ
jgi:hypothetical protein